MSDTYDHVPGTSLVLDNGLLAAHFDSSSGCLVRLESNGTVVQLDHRLVYYNASDGSAGPYKIQGAQGSGNYVFQPWSTDVYNFTQVKECVLVPMKGCRTFKTDNYYVIIMHLSLEWGPGPGESRERLFASRS